MKLARVFGFIGPSPDGDSLTDTGQFVEHRHCDAKRLR